MDNRYVTRYVTTGWIPPIFLRMDIPYVRFKIATKDLKITYLCLDKCARLAGLDFAIARPVMLMSIGHFF